MIATSVLPCSLCWRAMVSRSGVSKTGGGERGVRRQRNAARRAASARQARYRRRLRDGLMPVTIEIDTAIINLLIETKWLAEPDVADRHRIEAAIEGLLKASAAAENFGDGVDTGRHRPGEPVHIDNKIVFGFPPYLPPSLPPPRF